MKDFCVKVLDGDTLKVKGGDFIRLANVCAPELNEPGGAAAKRALEKLVLGKWVTYTQVGSSYGRIVTNVKTNGTDVNDHMRRSGYTC